MQNEESVLLMLSGGRDSYLSACRLVEAGYVVHMITYDNGCISDIEHTKIVADRIISKYGANQAKFAGIYGITSSLYRLQKAFLYQEIQKSSQEYPNLRPAQMPCLACHTGMYIQSIAYCRAHGISKLAEGSRKVQGFFVELPEMVKRYKILAQQHGIELLLPVYDLTDNWERKQELADFGFIPKSAEPQCWLGYPLGNELNSDEIKSLLAYYDHAIAPQLPSLIDSAVKKIGITRSSDAKSLQ